MNNTVQVALVDDSPIALFMLKQIINKDERLEVIWEANSAEEALLKLADHRPDILCTDFHMPGMDGIQLIDKIMTEQPLPTLLVSVSVQENERTNIFNALAAGAIDIFAKPRGDAAFSLHDEKALCDRIFLVSKVRVIRKHRSINLDKGPAVAIDALGPKGDLSDQIVAIGGSTGAPSVFYELLSKLPASFPVPIVCVQHIGQGFMHSFVTWLNSGSKLWVKEAEQGELIKAGRVYFAPDHYQFGIKGGRVDLVACEEEHCSHTPSIDYLFNSLHGFSNGVAVLLSGMGVDGAKGLLTLRGQGFHTIGQSESSATIYGMPREAKLIGAVETELDASSIASQLMDLTNSQVAKR